MDERKTIAEWSEEFGFSIMDPDGFDRTDPNLMDRNFTLAEFADGALMSTVGNLNADSFTRLADASSL